MERFGEQFLHQEKQESSVGNAEIFSPEKDNKNTSDEIYREKINLLQEKYEKEIREKNIEIMVDNQYFESRRNDGDIIKGYLSSASKEGYYISASLYECYFNGIDDVEENRDKADLIIAINKDLNKTQDFVKLLNIADELGYEEDISDRRNLVFIKIALFLAFDLIKKHPEYRSITVTPIGEGKRERAYKYLTRYGFKEKVYQSGDVEYVFDSHLEIDDEEKPQIH